jgi:hypothetical protein
MNNKIHEVRNAHPEHEILESKHDGTKPAENQQSLQFQDRVNGQVTVHWHTHWAGDGPVTWRLGR